MPAGPGRPPLVRNVFSYEDPVLLLPADVVLDTSFVTRALVTSESGHAEAEAFLAQLVDAETVVYFNRLLELELVEVAFKIAVVERHGKSGWPKKRADGRVRRRAGRLTRELLEAWGDFLRLMPHSRVELQEVADDVPTLMTAHGLGSYDAAHVATALYADVEGLVTTDAGFGAVPEKQLRLYVDDSRVRSCRRRRGGR